MKQSVMSISDMHWNILRWVLPRKRQVYDAVYEQLRRAHHLAPGRWGEGHLLFCLSESTDDERESPSSVFAYGVVEYRSSSLIVTVHDEADETIEAQFSGVGHQDEDMTRRYCYSYWNPGDPSPAAGTAVRELTLSPRYVLVLARGDEKLWIHDRETQRNILIPQTQFYVELTRVQPGRGRRQFHPRELFLSDDFTDEQLIAAFHTYNRSWRKVQLAQNAPQRNRSRLKSLFND